MANVFERCLRQQSRSPNTHSHANAHTQPHTQPHTATPRHRTPPSHSHDRDKGTFTHTGLGTHTQRHTGHGDTEPSPAQPVRIPRWTRPLGATETHSHLETQSRLSQTDTHSEADTQRQTHTFTVTQNSHSPLGSTQIFSYILLQLPNTHRTPLHTLTQQTHRTQFTLKYTFPHSLCLTQGRAGPQTHPHHRTGTQQTPRATISRDSARSGRD